MAKKDIFAIGGSTGSGSVLRRIVGELPGDLRASIFVATHVPAHSPGHLVEMLGAAVAELYEERAREYRRYATVLREAAVLTVRMGGRRANRTGDMPLQPAAIEA